MSKVSSVFTIGNAIKAMMFIGVIAVFLVVVQSCQKPKTGIDRFGVKSLQKLTSLEVPPQQPNVTFTSARSEATMTLQDYRGQVVLLNAWATWCPPCVAEMPSLDRLQAARGGEDFQVLTIALDRPEKVVTFFERNDIANLPDWMDVNYEINGRLRLPGMPTSILYDRNGREVARLAGEAEWDSPEALALIDYLVDS